MFLYSIFLYNDILVLYILRIALRAVPAFVTFPEATTLPQIKSGDGGKIKKPGKDFRDLPLCLSRLKNFVKVPGCTGFCVDT